MKSNPLTAAGSGTRVLSCDARPSGRAGFAKMLSTNLRLLGAFAALLFMAPLAIEPSVASNCGSDYRLNHSESDCMHAWWDNSPSSTCWGTKGGAQSFCSHLGTVKVKVDIISGTDRTKELSNSSKWRYTECLNDTREISCCIDESDLCITNQVSPDSDGNIKYFEAGNSTLQTASVDTHVDRYNFCQDNSDTIYCELDLQGDATIPPNCGDHDCTLADCTWHWNRSDASDTCRTTSMTLDTSNFSIPRCDIRALCEDADQTRGVNSEIKPKMWQVDDLVECDLEVKLSC